MTDGLPEREHEPNCIHCGLDYEFEMPDGLVDVAHRRGLVIFAGAGISTEVSTVFPRTVLEMAADALGVPRDKMSSFPDTLQEYQNRFGRTPLVKMIKTKLDFIDSFDELRYHARRFHRELATMPYLQDILTTNWDTYFEEECDATPFVSGNDIALYDMPGRRVLKIHGSISNLGSLVATEDDYAKRLEDLGSNVMGGLLRQLLSTKTLVFVGYSLTDWNFRRLYEALLADMREFAPRAYVVSPHAAEAVNDLGMTVIKTSGVKFLREVKKALIGPCFIADDAYDRVSDLLDSVNEAERIAKSVPHKEYPTVVYCWFYHDGMRAACQRIQRMRASGEYSDRHHIQAMLKYYDGVYDRAYADGRYDDAAYVDGYFNALMLLLDDELLNDDDEEGQEPMGPMIDELPLYFVYGSDSDMRSEEDFRSALDASRRRSPKTRALARKIAAAIPEGMIYTHGPFLPDIPVADPHA